VPRPSLKLKRRKHPAVVVGLEIEPSHIAAAEVHVNGDLTVKRGAVSMLQPGILRDGEVTDAEALAEQLQAFFAENELGTTVRLGVANQRIVVRTLDLPPLDDHKALTAAVRYQAPDHIPMPMDEAVLDFQPLGLVDTPAGQRARVVVVAIRRDMVERLAGVARQAGLKVVGIDLSAFAMIRALAGPELEGEHAALIVNVAGLTNVAVASGKSCLFTRAAGGGLETLAQTLAERRGLTLEHARQWLGHVGLETPVDEVQGEAEIVTTARAVLAEGVHNVADTVRNSLNFYRTQDNAETVDRAVLTGPAVKIAGFTEELGRQLKLPVSSAVVSAGSEDDGLQAERLTVAAGLAIEQRD